MEEPKFFWKSTLETLLDIQQQSTATSTSALFKQVQIGGSTKTAIPASTQVTGAADSSKRAPWTELWRLLVRKNFWILARWQVTLFRQLLHRHLLHGHLNLATAYTITWEQHPPRHNHNCGRHERPDACQMRVKCLYTFAISHCCLQVRQQCAKGGGSVVTLVTFLLHSFAYVSIQTHLKKLFRIGHCS